MHLEWMKIKELCMTPKGQPILSDCLLEKKEGRFSQMLLLLLMVF
jgi:hypothetical protein